MNPSNQPSSTSSSHPLHHATDSGLNPAQDVHPHDASSVSSWYQITAPTRRTYRKAPAVLMALALHAVLLTLVFGYWYWQTHEKKQAKLSQTMATGVSFEQIGQMQSLFGHLLNRTDGELTGNAMTNVTDHTLSRMTVDTAKAREPALVASSMTAADMDTADNASAASQLQDRLNQQDDFAVAQNTSYTDAVSNGMGYGGISDTPTGAYQNSAPFVGLAEGLTPADLPTMAMAGSTSGVTLQHQADGRASAEPSVPPDAVLLQRDLPQNQRQQPTANHQPMADISPAYRQAADEAERLNARISDTIDKVKDNNQRKIASHRQTQTTPLQALANTPLRQKDSDNIDNVGDQLQVDAAYEAERQQLQQAESPSE